MNMNLPDVQRKCALWMCLIRMENEEWVSTTNSGSLFERWTVNNTDYIESKSVIKVYVNNKLLQKENIYFIWMNRLRIKCRWFLNLGSKFWRQKLVHSYTHKPNEWINILDIESEWGERSEKLNRVVESIN